MNWLRWLACPQSAVPPEDDWLSPHERERLAGMRLAKRRGDYRLGRWTAKQAVMAGLREGFFDMHGGALEPGDAPDRAFDLRLSDIDVRAARDGAPEVRLPGGAGGMGVSIAHAGGRGLAVVGPRGAVFGADLESVEARSAAFLEDYLTKAERDFVYSQEEGRRAWAATLVWSAKEAVLKALRVGLREDTRAVEIACVASGAGGASPGGGFEPIRGVVLGAERVFSGLAAEEDGQVITVVLAEGDSGDPWHLRGEEPSRGATKAR